MPRGIWKGTLGFGLVTIGVELFAAESPQRLDLDLLDKRNKARIRYRKVNEATGEEVPPEDIVRGYAVEKDEYVILSDSDLKAANPRSTQTVEILGFVPQERIDLIYYDKPYFVGPLKGSERAYALLREVLRRSEQVAIAQIVIRTRQYVAAVYPHESALVIHLMRYHEELRELKSEGIERADEARATLRAPEIAMAEQLVESMAMEWKPEQYSDRYRQDVLELVEAKARGGRRVARAREAPEEAKVLDLMAALKRSVAAREGGGGKRAAPGGRKRRGGAGRPTPRARRTGRARKTA